MSITTANNSNSALYGATLLRVTLGGTFLAHVGLKILVFTPAGFAGYFAHLGLPAWLAYLTMAAELLGGVALVLGIQTRIVAVALTPLLLGTIAMVHGANGFFFNNQGGGWEYPAFWTITLLVQALLGDGLFALMPTYRFGRAFSAASARAA